MAREQSRAVQGHYPTQPRIIQAVSKLIKVENNVVALDAGSGTGAALSTLRQHWGNPNVKLLGIESDLSRAQASAQVLDTAVWAPIEDCRLVGGGVDFLWFNPPYDRVRGAGRTETMLFSIAKDWVREDGYLVLIVPDHTVSDRREGLAQLFSRYFHLIGAWRYPDPEYAEYNQCVLVGKRRSGKVNDYPDIDWATDEFPILPLDAPKPVATVSPEPGRKETPHFYRERIGQEVMRQVVDGSPLHHSLLRESAARAFKWGRPLLPMRPGHIALALAGGLCDELIEQDGVRFLPKGTLVRGEAVKKEKVVDEKGHHRSTIERHRTNYEVHVRCLRDDGKIEHYTTAEAPVPVVEGQVDEDEEEE
jgi:hypothetical protein